MDKRMLLAIALSALVLFGWQMLFPPPEPPVESHSAAQQQSAVPAGNSQQSAAEDAVSGQATSASEPMAPSLNARSATTVDQGERIELNTDLVRLQVATRGAAVLSYELLQHEAEGNSGDPVQMVVEGTRLLLTSLSLNDGSSLDLSGRHFDLVEQSDRELVFEIEHQGMLVRKHIGVLDGYRLSLRYEVEGGQDVAGILTTLPGDLVANVETDAFSFKGLVWKQPDEGIVKNDYPDDIDTAQSVRGAQFGGLMDKYFLGALLPAPGQYMQVYPDSMGQAIGLVSSAGDAVELYVGPKLKSRLEDIGLGLSASIDYGWFGGIAEPLMTVIRWFYGLTGNYGVAIILLTCVIKLLFFPLTQKSYVSMRKMAKLQPEMKKLREKHKNDPQRMNQATMELYKEHRVNPLSGCLPILVQIPVFIALYKALLAAIELRHAPFALWLHDLSAPDPFFITPVIMGATMLLQQKMTPSTMDPMQQKIMMAMPIVFTFLFLGMPSGLILYWIANNVLSIGQQYLINKKYA